ncbi:uncharacterized protein BDZ99DRAFT_398797, partial [Mytilinidion resinicola]
RNIIARWAASGLFPFNPDRVIRHTPKPPAELTIPNKVVRPQDEALQTPISPTTPVTTQALTSLHNLIKQEANKPGSKQRLQRHVQKLASAAQISFAKQTLLQDQNRFLYKLNKEAKRRRSTKSLILGKAKVMSYKDLKEARANRAAKDTAKGKGKGKRGRLRKNPAPEAEAEASKGKRVARMSEVEPAKVPEAPFRAPVARMY